MNTAQMTGGEQIHAALSESFWLADDGFWYPTGKGAPLVRIQITERVYTISRRRAAETQWMPLVEALILDFDPSTFATWCANWKLVDPTHKN